MLLVNPSCFKVWRTPCLPSCLPLYGHGQHVVVAIHTQGFLYNMYLPVDLIIILWHRRNSSSCSLTVTAAAQPHVAHACCGCRCQYAHTTWCPAAALWCPPATSTKGGPLQT